MLTPKLILKPKYPPLNSFRTLFPLLTKQPLIILLTPNPTLTKIPHNPIKRLPQTKLTPKNRLEITVPYIDNNIRWQKTISNIKYKAIYASMYNHERYV